MNAAAAHDSSSHLVLTTTSRAPRPGEQNDVDYRFRSEEAMRGQMERGEFVQVAPPVLSALYATIHDNLLFVVNDDLRQATAEFEAILQGQPPAFTATEGRLSAKQLLQSRG